MAYVLGLFAADGTMTKNQRGSCYVDFAVTDRELIVCVREALRSTHKIAIRPPKNPRCKPVYRLQVGSKRLFDRLLSLGFTPNKSKTLVLPTIPHRLRSHFVRGYFDGDGNIYFKRHFAKDRCADRWVFSSRFTSGSKAFLIQLHVTLRAYGVDGGRIATKSRGFELVLSHRDSVALYRMMYHNAGRMFLRRKRSLFEQAFLELHMRA